MTICSEFVPDPSTNPAHGMRPRGSVVDIFCGAGGLSHGFRLEGFRIAAGIDIDEGCRYPFEFNNRAPFVRKDVASLDPIEVSQLFFRDEPKVLVGCAPCQPFSTYNQGIDDPKWKLVGVFARLIAETRPDIVSMENVPRLVDFQGGAIFEDFLLALRNCGYSISYKIAFLPDYGVPQARSRLILLASRHGRITLPDPTCESSDYPTVDSAISGLPPLAAGATDVSDPLHQASRLSARNLARIRQARPGGSWKEWPESLVADCHRRERGKNYLSVYGRMRGDRPAPTITTQFFGFGNGRFGHPTQDRGLSLREGALLQSFPASYSFVPPGMRVHFKALGKMIGNAVPVTLARQIARSIQHHISGVGL